MTTTCHDFKLGQLFSSTYSRHYQFLRAEKENHSLIGLDITDNKTAGSLSNRLYKVPLNCIKDSQIIYPIQPAMIEIALHILENPGYTKPLCDTNMQPYRNEKTHNGRVEGLQLPLHGFEYMLLAKVQIK